MKAIIEYFNSLNLDMPSLLKAGAILLIGLIFFGSIGRYIFGKKSLLHVAASSAIAIIFVYTLTAILQVFGNERIVQFLAPLPFVTFTEDSILLFDFAAADYTVICTELLYMVILGFLVNLLDRWMPKGKKTFSWLFFRCLTVILATMAYLMVTGFFNYYLPAGIITYAPTILLVLLGIMLATGALKIVVGALVSTVNPLIAALYTFFFANFIGKQVTRAVFTAGIMSALIFGLRYVGVTALTLTTGALWIYVPFLAIMLGLWYVIRKVL